MVSLRAFLLRFMARFSQVWFTSHLISILRRTTSSLDRRSKAILTNKKKVVFCNFLRVLWSQK